MLKLAKTHDRCDNEINKLTVVFIHGIAADSSKYSNILEYLENDSELKDVRFVTYDLLGSGKSYTSDELNYDFEEQLEALDNSIKELSCDTPLVIVAHSMGTMIATRFADEHKDLVRGLVLVSPPIYRPEDIQNPLFASAMDGFRQVVGRKNSELLKSKAFNNEIKNIVSDVHNYDYFARVSQPTAIIYGELDKIIASFNLPGILKQNHNIKAFKTAGAHGISHDKYEAISREIKEFLN